VDPGALLRVNGLSSYSVYYAGMSLRIPQGSGNFPGSRALMNHPTSYTVRAGDTIHTIGCAFGDVDPNAIAVVNGLTPPYRLSVGQVLQIP
jgi:LysM repeat protein